MIVTPEDRSQAQDLLDFIDASPSPWHAVANLAARLESQWFIPLPETDSWRLESGGKYYVTRGGASLIAFVVGADPLAESGFRIVGAHTDSPGLRLKPRAPHAQDNIVRLGVEVYGGPILATFADRDLSLAGRIWLRTDSGPQARLVRFEHPLLRLPNLAIHMNRNVNEEGLKLNKQTELPLLLSNLEASLPPQQQFLALLAAQAGVDAGDIVSWELNVFDTQKGAFWGPDEEFIADSQLDNLASCHAGLSALLATGENRRTGICGLFDHEEVGSGSSRGADGSFLADVVERIAVSLGLDREASKRALANSFFVSADMAHAYQPNFPAAYEPQHQIRVNGGPVIKTNANLRYITDAESEAFFIGLCNREKIPYQQYAHRTDLACGSTIGPMVSSRLGVRAVDVGNPTWAMHSVRESAGVVDHGLMIRVLGAFYGS